LRGIEKLWPTPWIDRDVGVGPSRERILDRVDLVHRDDVIRIAVVEAHRARDLAHLVDVLAHRGAVDNSGNVSGLFDNLAAIRRSSAV